MENSAYVIDKEKIYLVNPTDLEQTTFRQLFNIKREFFEDIKLGKDDDNLNKENCWWYIAIKFKKNDLQHILREVCRFNGDSDYVGQIGEYHLFWFD